MKTAFPYRYILELPVFACDFGGAKYQGGDKAEARVTDELALSDKPPLTQCGETYKLTAGSSVKKDVLKKFTKFTEKHLWQSLF